jgi:signal transduction histidine kinase
MRQLLQNLISNSVKFARSDCPPVIKVYAQDRSSGGATAGSCTICVEDNGIGFDVAQLDRIFQVFERLHSRSEYDGTGMGLAICKKIAKRHGGDITATSLPDEGSTFIVTLPVGRTDARDCG